MIVRRRTLLKALGALGCAALPGRALNALAASDAARRTAADFCSANALSDALYVPSRLGWFGRLALDGAPLTVRAEDIVGGAGTWTQGLVVQHRGRRYVNPTLVLKPGERVRVELENVLHEPTLLHWHGLAVDTKNDGSMVPPIAPGERYAYDFEVRDRGALYWYHPHPHGLTAGQVYRGLFGLIEVEDDDERALRAALDLAPGQTEFPLILQDRRGADYVPTDADRLHGWLGNDTYVNGTVCPYLDVASRVYRFRVINASNARTYRLGFRAADGKPVPFMLIGTDAGLLAGPRRCDEAFLASAERIDILIDLRDAAVGDTLMLETRAFDPMHMEVPPPAATLDHATLGHAMPAPPAAASAPMDHAAMDHAMPAPATSPMAVDHAAMGHAMPAPATSPMAVDHAAMGHGGSFPEGAPRTLLQLRVRERVAYRAAIPQRLSTIAPIDLARASERPIRLGFAKGNWRINDRVFAMGETPIEVRRNTVEVWLIRNYFNSMPHAMHLHGFHFQVLERQTSPDTIAALKIDDRGRLATDLGWKDTVLVWPGESVKIAIDFSLPFAGEQSYVFHCHNLEHEDSGMMLGVKVA